MSGQNIQNKTERPILRPARSESFDGGVTLMSGPRRARFIDVRECRRA